MKFYVSGLTSEQIGLLTEYGAEVAIHAALEEATQGINISLETATETSFPSSPALEKSEEIYKQ